MARMSPAVQSKTRESLEEARERETGQEAYFSMQEKAGKMPPSRRDLLESKVGLHPRRIVGGGTVKGKC